MTILSNQISIDTDLDKAFGFISTFENMPMWNYYILEVNKVGNEGKYHVIRKNDEQNFELLEIEENKRFLLKLQSSKLITVTREMIFHFEKKVLLIDNIKIDSILPGFIERFASKKIQEAVGDNLEKLKELLETGKTTLQDGRETTIS
ncbi:MAG: hypothetical protein NXI20_11555 [bacterium]|nr:hypothetical protein [bacterium]